MNSCSSITGVSLLTGCICQSPVTCVGLRKEEKWAGMRAVVAVGLGVTKGLAAAASEQPRVLLLSQESGGFL